MFFNLDVRIDNRILKSLSKIFKFKELTPVQNLTIPITLQQKDLLINSSTGSGKTLGYLIPILQIVLDSIQNNKSKSSLNNSIIAIILVPTNELCKEVGLVLKSLMRYCSDLIDFFQISNETTILSQIPRLRDNPNIIIATPARLAEHISRKNIDFKNSSLKYFVIDEADLILTFGFEDDIKIIVNNLPEIHNSILVSAIRNSEIKTLQKLVLREPQIIDLEKSGEHYNNDESCEDENKEEMLKDSIKNQFNQYYFICRSELDKYLALYSVIRLGIINGKTIIVVHEINTAYKIKLFLEHFTIRAAVFNNELPINSRFNILEQFNRGVFDLIIVTDLSLIDPKLDYDENKGEISDDLADVEISDSKTESSVQKIENFEDNESLDSNISIDFDSGLDSTSENHDDDSIENKEADINDDDAEIEDLSENDLSDSDLNDIDDSNLPNTDKSLNHNGAHKGGYSNFEVKFKNVRFIIHFDLSLNYENYSQRIEKVLPNNSSNKINNEKFSLSFVLSNANSKLIEDNEFPRLNEFIEKQKSEHQKEQFSTSPSYFLKPLEAQISDFESFRYRVQDIIRAVTKYAIKQARAKELRFEILNSKNLKQHFQENPSELHFLRQDKFLNNQRKLKQGLDYIPSYLIKGSSNKKAKNNLNISNKSSFMSRARKRRQNFRKMFKRRANRRRVDPLKRMRSQSFKKQKRRRL